MATAADILARKHGSAAGQPPHGPVFHIRPVDSVYDAVARMAEHEVGALLVMIEGSLVGIVSERDYARKVILRDRSSHTTRVSEIMTHEVLTAHPQDSLDACLERMSRHHIRHLPVVEDGAVLGMLSTRDILTALVAQREPGGARGPEGN